MRTIAYIGLGSNLSKPVHQIKQAITTISNVANIQLLHTSSLYISRPMGPQDQDDYVNAVIAIETTLSAIELLNTLQAIENNAGRVRKENRWGARILDCDILLFGNDTINSERLTVPHYGLTEREFVLLPLAEVSKNLLLPDGTSIKYLAQKVEKNGIRIHNNH